MKIINSVNILIVKLLFFGVCNVHSLHLQVISQSINSYQITSYFSKNFTKISLSNTFLFGETPNVLHSFGTNLAQNIYNQSYQIRLKHMFSLQESLIVFYTTSLSEAKLFIDFLVLQVSVRQRPKCLIVHFSNFEVSNLTKVSHILKYSWKNKFLDFSIIERVVKNIYVTSALLNYFNPFNGIVYQNELNEDTEIFPCKFQNTFGYSIHVSKVLLNQGNFNLVKQPNQKIKWLPYPEFEMKFIGAVMNLNVIVKVLPNLQLEEENFFDHHKLDIHTQYITSPVNHLSTFVIPIDRPFKNFIAVVPILRFPRIEFTLKTIYTVIIIPGIVFTVMYGLNFFKIRIKQFTVWDIFVLILGQSIGRKLKRLIHKVVFLTIVIGSVKMTNDFLLDTLLIQFDNNEIPFET